MRLVLWDNEVIPGSVGSPRHLDDMFFFLSQTGSDKTLGISGLYVQVKSVLMGPNKISVYWKICKRPSSDMVVLVWKIWFTWVARKQPSCVMNRSVLPLSSSHPTLYRFLTSGSLPLAWIQFWFGTDSLSICSGCSQSSEFLNTTALHTLRKWNINPSHPCNSMFPPKNIQKIPFPRVIFSTEPNLN